MEVDLAKLISLAESPNTAKTVSGLDSILKQMDGIEKIVKNVDTFISVLEKSPSLSAAVRIIAKQNDVSLEPLRKDVVKEIVEVEKNPPKSDTHRKMFEELNKLSEDQLKQMVKEQENGRLHTDSGKTQNK